MIYLSSPSQSQILSTVLHTKFTHTYKEDILKVSANQIISLEEHEPIYIKSKLLLLI